MNLSVRLFASLRERAGADRLEVRDLRDGATVGELKAALERARPDLGSLAHVAGVVGTAYAADARVLRPDADDRLRPPVAGAAPGPDELLARGVFELWPERLDASAAQARVAHQSCGAIALFTGTTRDENRGHSVVRLDYEAFEAMTGPEMERIFERCRAELSRAAPADRARETLRMLVQHRVGTVLVGEPSVVIAVASPHRDSAFAAARFLIDELKRSLPIWKKEVYADGHHWIGDRS